MSETAAPTEAPQTEEAVDGGLVAFLEGKPLQTKDQLYTAIVEYINSRVEERFGVVRDRVKEKTKMEISLRRVFGDDDGRDIVVGVFRELIKLTLTPAEGQVGDEQNLALPGGLGSFQLLTAGATKKRTPQGEQIDVPRRRRFKYNPGKVVDGMLKELPPLQQTATQTT